MDSRDATEGDEVVSLMSSLRDLEKWTAEIKFFPCIEKSQDLLEMLYSHVS